MAEAEHSLYSASAAERWINCAGSIPLGMDSLASGNSRYAAEGTVAHAIAAECLTKGAPAADFIGELREADGYAFTVDEDMAEAIQVYLDNVAQYAGDTAPMLKIEVKVNYSAPLGVKAHEAWGTADVVLLYPDEIGVHDLKFGRGTAVSPIENSQMMLYALGVVDEYAELFGYDDDTKVTMVIHQPRIVKAPQEWSCTVKDLREFGARTKLAVHNVKAAIWGYASWKNDGRLATTFAEWLGKYTAPGSHCKWCKALGSCPTARNAAVLTAANLTPRHAPATPDEFRELPVLDRPAAQAAARDADWLAAALVKVDEIEAWITAVRAEGESRLLAGRDVPGFKLVQGRHGPRKWTDPKDAEERLKAMRLKVEEMYDLSLISPTTAEKRSKGKEPAIGPRQWKSLQGLIVRAEGKIHLAPASDERPAIQVKPAASEFDDLSQSVADDIG